MAFQATDRTFRYHDEGDNVIYYQSSHVDAAAAVRYYGFVTEKGAWLITKDDSTTGITSEFTYAKGKSGYTAAWAGRVGLTYTFFDGT